MLIIKNKNIKKMDKVSTEILREKILKRLYHLEPKTKKKEKNEKNIKNNKDVDENY